MSTHPLAGKPAPASMLANIPRLVTAYFCDRPDPARPEQRVAFGTSGHRGSSLKASFNEAHILATTQAICDYRRAQGTDGPLFLGMDSHALSEPAFASALEVSMAPHGTGAALTLREHYHPAEGPDREERLKEVDASLTPWGVALRRHLLAQGRWGWLPFYRRLREGFWLSMTPLQRRIGRLLIWISALEFAVFLVVLAIFVAAR